MSAASGQSVGFDGCLDTRQVMPAGLIAPARCPTLAHRLGTKFVDKRLDWAAPRAHTKGPAVRAQKELTGPGKL